VEGGTMATKLIGVLLIVAAIVSVVVAQDKPKDEAKPLARGDKVTLVATYGQVPVFIDEKTCKSYLVAAKATTPQAYELIRSMFNNSSLELIRSGEEAVIENIDSLVEKNGSPKKLPLLDNILNPVLVPYIAVKFKDQEAPEWVPIVYLKQPSGKPYGIETRFPVLVGVDDFSVTPEPGKIMYITNNDDSEISIADGLGSYDDMKKAIAANDDVGIRELLRNGSIKRIPAGSRAKIIERHANPFIKAAEVRLIDGPVKGQVWWVQEQFTAVRSVVVYPYQAVKNAMKTQPKKKK
jgi:hypothetical protein